MPDGGHPGERMPAMNDDEYALGPLLTDAGILIFEYDVDGFLIRASGSCLGGADPTMEVRAGLVTPSVVRRAAAGQIVIDEINLCDRTIAVRHEPVRDEAARIVRIVATACDVTGRDARFDPSIHGSLPAAS